MEVKSKQLRIEAPAEKLYDYVSNFSHLKMALPEQVSHFVATENECSFEVSGMAQISLRMKEKKRPNRVCMETVTGKSPIALEMVFDFTPLSESSCEACVKIEAEVPIFLSGMVKKPLEKLVSVIAEQLEKIKG